MALPARLPACLSAGLWGTAPPPTHLSLCSPGSVRPPHFGKSGPMLSSAQLERNSTAGSGMLPTQHLHGERPRSCLPAAHWVPGRGARVSARQGVGDPGLAPRAAGGCVWMDEHSLCARVFTSAVNPFLKQSKGGWRRRLSTFISAARPPSFCPEFLSSVKATRQRWLCIPSASTLPHSAHQTFLQGLPTWGTFSVLLLVSCSRCFSHLLLLLTQDRRRLCPLAVRKQSPGKPQGQPDAEPTADPTLLPGLWCPAGGSGRAVAEGPQECGLPLAPVLLSTSTCYCACLRPKLTPGAGSGPSRAVPGPASPSQYLSAHTCSPCSPFKSSRPCSFPP